MNRILLLFGLLSSTTFNLFSQSTLDYTLEIEAEEIPGLEGLHSYAFAQHDGKWLIIGGRKDGLHARQPFNAFPESHNNSDIYVIDLKAQQFWTASLNSLTSSLKEQLQSTNMNFHQNEDTLTIIGGYAYSATLNDHITFPNLTTVWVSSLIDDVINGASINSNFKQITDSAFAVTGGHLGMIGNQYYLVGGQRFDGRYNPMGHATYVQTYSNQIRKFNLHNNGSSLSFSNYSTITDQIHLRRRDYNLTPQIFPNGEHGYTISSGVFQIGVDLPFLYPVDIRNSGHTAITTFNQYLSNYHSAFTCIYDSIENEMHSIFFGGISQYYYENGSLIKDDNVPFVKTISQITRFSDGTLQEYQLPIEMPGLVGASAEFILNPEIAQYKSGIVNLNQENQDTILLGHIYGGINSPTLNPFSVNQTAGTSASSTIYSVKLIKEQSTGVHKIDGSNPYNLSLYPNPMDDEIIFEFDLNKTPGIYFFLSNSSGQILDQGKIADSKIGRNRGSISLDSISSNQILYLTFVFDDVYYITKKIIRK